MNRSNSFLLSVATALTLCVTTNAQPSSVATMQRDFRELELGMFIHFNMATYKGAQWVRGYADPADFNPGGKIDTDAWAEAAASAGMTYAVLTAKHVSGFCLWDSEYTTFDVMHPDCPYQQDLVRQFIDSFTRKGIKVGLYYCWRSPGFDDTKYPNEYKVLPPEYEPSKLTLREEIDIQQKQIAELVKKYPEVFYIWNDGLDDTIMTAEEAKAFVRGLPRPVIASSNWWDWGKKGTPFVDIAVKEKRHFPEDNSFTGETCWQLESQWFWVQGAVTGPVDRIIGHMDKALGRNSNFLLNVGPDQQGRLLPTSLEALKKIGEHRRNTAK